MEENKNFAIEKCAVCEIPASKYCSNCKKICYCSPEHQKQHRKLHKKDCYPVILQEDQTQGRHFITTKALTPSDVIFHDDAIIHGPSGAESYLHLICLGCYKVVQNGYKCSKCAWPVCNQNCENMPNHSNFECSIFVKNQIVHQDTITRPVCYDLIKYLRTALMKEKDPDYWTECISTMASHIDQRSTNPLDVYITKCTFEFIHDNCGLTQFDFETINHIVGIWTVNSFGANPPSGRNPIGIRLVSFLFPKTAIASHNCIPNTRGILLEETQKHNTLIFRMKLVASNPIQLGQSIYTTYANVNEGTYERQQVLNESYYFSCHCTRCLDPTELGTWFSAIKCRDCTNGYLLPSNPIDPSSKWKCFQQIGFATGDGCNKVTTYEFISIPIYQPKHRLDEVMSLVDSNSKLESIKSLEVLLSENVNVVLHSNHWLIIDIEYNLIQLIVSHILTSSSSSRSSSSREVEKSITNDKKKKGNNKTRSAMSSSSKSFEYFDENILTSRLIELCQHCLSIANLIQPGFNSYRGKILYCLVEGKLNQIILETNNCSKVCNKNLALLQKQQLQSTIQNAEEAYKILSIESELSENGCIAMKLKSRISQLELMMSCV